MKSETDELAKTWMGSVYGVSIAYVLALAGALAGLYLRAGLRWGERPLPAAYCYTWDVRAGIVLVCFCAIAPLGAAFVRNRARLVFVLAIPLVALAIATFVYNFTLWDLCARLW